MKMTELTRNELDILIESVDHWVEKDMVGGLLDGLLLSMIGKDAPEQSRRQMEMDRSAKEEERKAQKRLRKEQAIILKAKLLSIRDGIEAEELCR